MTTPPPADLLDLTGRVVVVTGAGGTIGAGIADRLAAAGATIAAQTRSSPIDLAGDDHSRHRIDLTEPGGPQALVDEVVATHGRLDGLVNNAGIQPIAALADVTDDEWRDMLDTNVTAVHRLTTAAAAVMVEGDGGSIVHIASIEGSQPAPLHEHYSVSKAAVIMHARAAASAYGQQGVRVNVVSPGLIGRDGIDEAWPEGVARWRAAAPLERLGTAQDVGDACVFLVSDLSRWITGAELVVDGGVLTRPTW